MKQTQDTENNTSPAITGVRLLSHRNITTTEFVVIFCMLRL